MRLADILILGIPILVISTLLVIKTRAIKILQRRYNVQMVIFRGILVVGYLFFALGVFLVTANLLELFGYEFLEDAADTLWHAVALAVLIALTWSFYHYYRLLTQPSEKV
jgi:hypothetical protein